MAKSKLGGLYRLIYYNNIGFTEFSFIYDRNLPLCFSIPIPEEDPFYSQFGKTCLDFTRSATHCSGQQDQQVNTVTAFLDGSVIYGTSRKRALKLRGGKKREGGRLLGNTHLPRFLPSKFDLNMKSSPSDKSTDFVAGDDRVETQASLTSVQNLFFNEHNRIAEALAKVWQEKVKDAKELDELVYQETRRLVTAQLQHVTFTEWLPSILGSDLTRSLGISHEQCEYKDKVESGIINSFAAAAFRFGHSLVQSVFRSERLTDSLTDIKHFLPEESTNHGDWGNSTQTAGLHSKTTDTAMSMSWRDCPSNPARRRTSV